jgi:hypothetical protein
MEKGTFLFRISSCSVFLGFLSVMFFAAFAIGCDECKSSADCPLGQVCHSGECGSAYTDTDTDADTDTGSDTDSDIDTDTDSDTDTETDTETDTDNHADTHTDGNGLTGDPEHPHPDSTGHPGEP